MPAAVQLLILVAVMLMLWMLLMRPARNQQRAMRETQRSIEVGDEVVISAGIFGTVRSVDETSVALEIAPDTVVKVARQVVVRRADDVPGERSEDDDVTTNPVETDEKSE